MLDKPGVVWYYNTRKREGKPEKNQKGKKKMPIDLTNLSYHVRMDRKERLAQIKSIGIGAPIANKEEMKNGQKIIKTLTSTGIIVIRAAENNMIITMYLAEFDQAEKFFRKQYGLKLPKDIGNKIKLNNIMFPAC